MNHPPARILVVDDVAVLRHTLATLLRRQGYKVRTAVDRVEADEWPYHDAFDLLILDIYMPSGVSSMDIAHRACMYQYGCAMLILTESDPCINMMGDESRPPFAIMFKSASPQDIVDRVAALLEQKQEQSALIWKPYSLYQPAPAYDTESR